MRRSRQAFSAPSKQTRGSSPKDELNLTASINASSTTSSPSFALLDPGLKVCDSDPNTIYLNASEETSYIVGIEGAVVIGVARPCYRNTDASRTPRLDQRLAGAGYRTMS